MASIKFTPQLERFLSVPTCAVGGRDLGSALAEVFEGNPSLRSYLLDDQGEVRKHVAIFVDGVLVKGRGALKYVLKSESEVYVMQALSGG